MASVTIDQRPNSISKDLSYEFPAIQLARTGRFIRLIGRITFVTLVASLVSMFLVPWRQTARGTGEVLALNPQERPQPVKSPGKGVISWVKDGLQEGSRVVAGETLVRLTPFAEDQIMFLDQQIHVAKSKMDRAESNVEVAEQAIKLQQSWGDFTGLSLIDSLEAAKQKFEQAEEEVRVFEAELEDKNNQSRVAQAVGRAGVGIVSRQDVFSKQRAAEAAQGKLDKAIAKRKESKSYLSEKQQLVSAYEKKIALENRYAVQKRNDAIQKRELAAKEWLDLRTKRGELDRLDVKAPCSGTIQQWYGVEGADNVKVGDQLFVIVPETDNLGVEMKVSGNDMPLIKEGDKVRLQFEGWPAVQFVGWPSVAVGTFGGKVSRVFPTDDGKGNFRVLISPDDNSAIDDGWPNDRYLRQGVRANGWVLLNEVPLGYEIWRQLNGFPPTVADEEPAKDKKKGSKVKLPKA